LRTPIDDDPTISRDAATHIFIECFSQYEVLSEADPGQLADYPRLQEFVIDFEIVCSRVLTPVELKLFRMKVKYRKRQIDCVKSLQITSWEYWNMKQRIRIKLGRGLHDYHLWPVEKYFDENHQKKVSF
jgi:hypothetical protein